MAIGAMRLSTEEARDDDRSLAVLHAAFDAGVEVIDTADAYALDASEAGHNERLIARALRSWSGDRSLVTVITKGGLTRPGGQWVPDGRARSLTAACHASCAALDVPRIALYQLHAPDPRVQWTTTVRALAALQRAGIVDDVGLCNVTVGQIEAARRIVDIASVQVELSAWNDRYVASGVVPFCLDHNMRVFAFRPFGGVKGKRRVEADAQLAEIAAGHAATPFEIVLAWMRTLAPHIVPLPGPTQVVSAQACGHAGHLVLTPEEQSALDDHFPLGRLRRRDAKAQVAIRASSSLEDIVMVMGLPGAGKSTLAARLVADGYERLNRDEAGGTLAEIAQTLGTRLDAHASRIVLDNTYVSRASRSAVISTAAARDRGVKGIWLDTDLEDAQVNAVWRMVQTHGRLLSPAELGTRRAPDAIAPSALFRAQRELERPQLSEGFASLDIVPFHRAHDPRLINRAVIFWCDGVLRRSRSGSARPTSSDDVEAIESRREALARYHAAGWRLMAISWEPEITEQEKPVHEVERGFGRLRERLGVDIEFQYCPHGGGPPVCWCRKPLPGLGVLLIDRHQLDPAQCIYVGATPQDPPFARRLGFAYQTVDEFFASLDP